jgi:hypothetical protein
MSEHVIAVIRSAGERTLHACKEILSKQIHENNLHVIKEIPFEKSLRQCYEIGIQSKAKWLLTLDADVLLLSNAVSQLLTAAENMPENYVQLEGRVFDKVLGIYRQAGHRIYRTKHLPIAIGSIPPQGTQIRPECFTLKELGKKGYPSRRIPAVVGIHDFEQYYKDLYRKAFVHAKKHTGFAPELLSRCAQYQTSDSDFKAILQGFWDGLLFQDNVSIDIEQFSQSSFEAITAIGLSEKEQFNIDLTQTIDEWITSCMEPPPPLILISDDPSKKTFVKKERLCMLYRERGLFKTIFYSIGVFLINIGSFFKHRLGAKT